MVLPFMLFMFGITSAPVLSILLLVFSLIAWPPWADALIDAEVVRARGTVVSMSAVERSKRGTSSYYLTTRIDTGRDKGKTARVFCSVSHVSCPGVGKPFDFEYCASDRDIGRMPGGSATVLPPVMAIGLAVGAIVGWGLILAAIITFLRRPALRAGVKKVFSGV